MLPARSPHGRTSRHWHPGGPWHAGARRAGVSSLDYVLVLAVMLPMVTFIWKIAKPMMQMTYEMVCVLVAWPFM